MCSKEEEEGLPQMISCLLSRLKWSSPVYPPHIVEDGAKAAPGIIIDAAIGEGGEGYSQADLDTLHRHYPGGRPFGPEGSRTGCLSTLS